MEQEKRERDREGDRYREGEGREERPECPVNDSYLWSVVSLVGLDHGHD